MPNLVVAGIASASLATVLKTEERKLTRSLLPAISGHDAEEQRVRRATNARCSVANETLDRFRNVMFKITRRRPYGTAPHSLVG